MKSGHDGADSLPGSNGAGPDVGDGGQRNGEMVTLRTDLEIAIQRYSDLYDSAPIPYVTFSQIGRIEQTNLATASLLGLSRNLLIGCPMSIFIDREDTQTFLRHLLRCRRSHTQVETELRIRTRTHNTVYVILCSTPISSLSSDVIFYQTAIVDLTEHYRAEQILRESEARTAADLRDMTRLHAVGTCCVSPISTEKDVLKKILDAGMAITRADKGSIQVLDFETNVFNVAVQRGFSRDMEGRLASITEMLVPRKRLTAKARRVIIEDVASSKHFASQRSKKVLFQAGIRAVEAIALVNSADKVIGVVSVYFAAPHCSIDRELRLVDLLAHQAAGYLERRESVKALQKSEYRYRTLFDLVPAMVYTCDAQGVIIEYNQHALSLWGHAPRNDPTYRYCGSWKVFDSDGRPMTRNECPMARVLRGEKLLPVECEIVIEREDGGRRNLIVSPTALKNLSGKIVGAINCLYDITERKQAETELAEKKNELDLVLGETPFMLTRCSRDLCYRYASAEYARFLGRTSEKLAGKPIVAVLGKKVFSVIQPFIK